MVCHLHQSKQFRILRIPILTTTKRQAVGILWLVGFLRARTVYYTSRRMLARCPVSGFRKFVRVVLVNLSARGGCTDSTVHHVVLYTNLLFMSYRSKTIAPAPLKFTEPSNSKSKQVDTPDESSRFPCESTVPRRSPRERKKEPKYCITLTLCSALRLRRRSSSNKFRAALH